jgi:4-nitrophenyl phosphatase
MTSFTLSQIKALILDMDGVLWQGSEPIGNLPAIFGRISELGFKVAMATNNATRTPRQVVERLRQFVVSAEPWQIVGSAQVAAEYLAQRHPKGGKVYVIGEMGLTQALAERDFTVGEENVLAVVVGMDRQLSYEKLRRATLLIRAGALFLGTNPDKTFPTPEGLVPGAGSILAALETSTGISPVIVGKPSPAMYRLALARLGTSPKETLVVGDRLETDIIGAQEIGCCTALVLSGVTSPQAARNWQPQPDIIAPDLADLIDKM